MVANDNGVIVKRRNKGKRPRGIGSDGWFTETATMWPGQKFSLALEDSSSMTSSILFHEESEYQEILVFQSAQYGKVFVIDGILQLTERDAFTFHEMMSHLPLFSHWNPERVLIVGGGDGIVDQLRDRVGDDKRSKGPALVDYFLEDRLGHGRTCIE